MGSCERGLAQTPVFDVPMTVASSRGVPPSRAGELGWLLGWRPRVTAGALAASSTPACAAQLSRGRPESGVGGAVC